jgi:hypothetical protein
LFNKQSLDVALQLLCVWSFSLLISSAVASVPPLSGEQGAHAGEGGGELIVDGEVTSGSSSEDSGLNGEHQQ